MTEPGIEQDKEPKKFEGPLPEVSAEGLEAVLGQATAIAVDAEQQRRYANRGGEYHYKAEIGKVQGIESHFLRITRALDQVIPNPTGESWAAEVRQRATTILDEEEANPQAPAESRAA